MNRMLIIVSVLILLILGGGILVMNRQKSSPPPLPDPVLIKTPVQIDESSSTVSITPEIQKTVEEFTVEGSNMKFSKTALSVKKGDKVRITFKNTQGTHDFVLDEFKVKTNVLQAGAEEVVEFTADKAGTYEYYCSVGKHRELGMKGTLTVTE